MLFVTVADGGDGSGVFVLFWFVFFGLILRCLLLLCSELGKK